MVQIKTHTSGDLYDLQDWPQYRTNQEILRDQARDYLAAEKDINADQITDEDLQAFFDQCAYKPGLEPEQILVMMILAGVCVITALIWIFNQGWI